MKRGEVDLVVTGADRIAANGDTANKIGTYSVAVLARHHGIPFYVAAPSSTIDPVDRRRGAAIVIEEREAAEVRGVAGRQTAPAGTRRLQPRLRRDAGRADQPPSSPSAASFRPPVPLRASPLRSGSGRVSGPSPPTATLECRAAATTTRTAHSPRVGARGAATCSTGRPSRSPFKIYPDLPADPLADAISPRWPLDTFARARARRSGRAPGALDLERLAALLFFSAGVTRVKTYPGGAQVHFRAAAVDRRALPDRGLRGGRRRRGARARRLSLQPGRLRLRRLRAGDFRGAVALAAADDAMAAQPAIADPLGDLLAQYLEVPGARLPASLLGLGHAARPSSSRWRARSTCPRAWSPASWTRERQRPARPRRREGRRARPGRPVGAAGAVAAAPPVIATLAPAVIPLSSREVDYPVLRDAYDNSSLDSEAEVLDWREAAAALSRADVGTQDLTPLPAAAGRGGALARGDDPGARVHARVLGRGDQRGGAVERALPRDARVRRPMCRRGWWTSIVNVHAVTGIEPGAYAYRPRRPRARRCLRAGDVREAIRLPLPRAGRWAGRRARPSSSSPIWRACSSAGAIAATGSPTSRRV